MVIGLVTASLSIPEARSLKDKRMVIRSLKDRIMNRMNVSVAEVGKQDMWQYCDLAFVTVAAEKVTVDQRVSGITEALSSDPRYVLMTVKTELL